MESEELAVKVDQTYKNLLDKFNPTARQLISAGKAYLKSLQGASTSSKVYLDVLSKLAHESQQSPTGVSTDIGRCLAQVVDVYKEVQAQQNNILKAFYLDFIVPLETNIEKDAKILQTEHKKFCSNHKVRRESLTKAENSMRKQRKKKSTSRSSAEKEIKSCQKYEEEKGTMNQFLDQFLRNATGEERRRYSFILERLCSFGRHHLALHGKGAALLQKHLDEWSAVSGSKVVLTPENITDSRKVETEGIYSTPTEELEDRIASTRSPVRRTQSLDGFIDDEEVTSFHYEQHLPEKTLARAKSEFSIDHCNEESGSNHSKKNLLLSDRGRIARASYTFSATTGNQLALQEGDVINLIGEKNKGWQYGENQRTREIGWFPVAYTENLQDEDDSALGCSYSETSAKQKRNPRGQSLDRLDKPSKKEMKIRTRSVSSNFSRRFSQHVPTGPSALHIQHQNVNKETKTNKIPRPSGGPGSSYSEAETKKTFETYNSHLFLSSDMEEDLQSYEGSYRQNRQTSDKLTIFRDDFSVSPSLCRSLTSPELPECFRKSVSSKDSIQCSDDSGFSNEENVNAPPRVNNSGYSQSLSKSPAQSWVSDSFAACEECNPKAKPTSQQPDIEKSSPAFLSYLYPANRSYGSSSFQCSSIEGLDDLQTKKREHWIISTFGTFGRKKKNLVSPCAQKIATQKARRKNERPSLRRSSSLLCIDVCGGADDPLYASNYEPIQYSSWHHVPLVSVPQGSLPSPPPFAPPPLPDKSSSLQTQQYIQQQNLLKKQQEQETSSGNSSWSESTCLEAYMIVSDQSKEISTKRNLNRSKTWGAPDSKKTSSKLFSTKRNKSRESEGKVVKPSYPKSPPPKPLHASPVKGKKRGKRRDENEAPPLPPRRMAMPSKSDVNILNYSEWMSKRLANPEGTCRFDQRSFTTGQRCSAWYDLWGDNPYKGKLV